MDREEKMWKAYMTLEASMLMPMILGGIVFTLYLGFYLYNVCLLQQVAYTAALRGSLIKEGSNEQIEEYTKNELNELLSSRLLAIKEWEGRVEVSSGKVRIWVSATTCMPFGEWLSSRLGFWEYETNVQATRMDAVSHIRGIRILGG